MHIADVFSKTFFIFQCYQQYWARVWFLQFNQAAKRLVVFFPGECYRWLSLSYTNHGDNIFLPGLYRGTWQFGHHFERILCKWKIIKGCLHGRLLLQFLASWHMRSSECACGSFVPSYTVQHFGELFTQSNASGWEKSREESPVYKLLLKTYFSTLKGLKSEAGNNLGMHRLGNK